MHIELSSRDICGGAHERSWTYTRLLLLVVLGGHADSTGCGYLGVGVAVAVAVAAVRLSHMSSQLQTLNFDSQLPTSTVSRVRRCRKPKTLSHALSARKWELRWRAGGHKSPSISMVIGHADLA